MKQERLFQIIKGPHVSEKSAQLNEKNQIVFKVDVGATKAEIREAVETLFEVKVDAVHTILVKGKSKRFGLRSGRTKNYKKAYVSLDKSINMEDFLSEQA